jgi:TRAP-type C4-dicarboxylate transport system substrate-binding protein
MKKAKSLTVVWSIGLSILAMGLVLGAYAAPSPAATPAKPIELSLSFWGTFDEPIGKIVQEYSTEINQRTNGMVKITIYPGGSLTPGPQAYEGVVNGLSQMALVMYPYNPGRFPLIMGWTLPLPVPSTRGATQIFNESVERFKPKELADTKLMYFTSTSAAYPMSAKKPIRTIEDFKGLKIRTLGNMALYMQDLGATPVSMPINDLYGALDKGVVDATLNNTHVLAAWKFADIIKYLTPWVWKMGGAWGVHMNLKVWNGLSPEIQKIFEEANKKYLWKQVEYIDSDDKVGVEAGLKKGMQIIEETPELRNALKKRAQTSYDRYVADLKAKGLPGQDFLAFLLKRCEEVK